MNGNTVLDRLQALKRRFTEIEELLARLEIATDHEGVRALAEERASMEKTVDLFEEYR